MLVKSLFPISFCDTKVVFCALWLVAETLHLYITLCTLQFQFIGHSFLFLQLHDVGCFSVFDGTFLLCLLIMCV